MNPERLNFSMPAFARRCWVSEAARARWEAPLQDLADRTRALEWRSVAAGLRAAALVDLEPGEAGPLRAAVTRAGLSLRQLRVQPRVAPGMSHPAVIARAGDGGAVVEAWDRGEVEAVLASLGAPPCCAAAQASWRAEGWRDLTWPSMGGDGPAAVNRLLASVGIYAVPFAPCGPGCRAAASLARDWLDLGESEDKAAEQLEAVLDWPMTWTGLHGIAELRTPVFQLCTDTDATGLRMELGRVGGAPPAEAGVGTRFPYTPPDRYRITGAKGWRRGLDNPLDSPARS